MKKFILYSLLTSLFVFGTISESQAQCKKFTKKECLSTLSPYTYNGQLNSAILSEGDVAELLLTFHEGQEYRVSVCSQEMIGEVQFKIFDTKNNLIFEKNKDRGEAVWDFVSNSTQQLIIQVTVSSAEMKDEILKTGCVTILIGFLDKEKQIR